MAIVWNEAMFRKYYSLSNGQGGWTTYGRVGWRYYLDPQPEWNYQSNSSYPDHPANEYRWRVEHLVSAFGIAPSSRVLVLGCGFGHLAETFIWWKMQNGIAQATAQGQVAGVDNSQFIQANATEEIHPLMSGKVVNRSLLDGAATTQMRNALRTAAGGSEFFDYVITESVIESYTDAERPAFLTACESYQGPTKNLSRVIHAVFPLQVFYPPGGGAPIVSGGWDPTQDGGAPNRSLSEWAATRPQNSWISLDGHMPHIAGTG